MHLFRCLLTASLLAGSVAVAQEAQNTTSNPASTPAASDQKSTASMPALPPPHKVDYSKPVSHFPWLITPYMPRHVPEPRIANTARIDQVMQDGKIMLSLDDAIALALENNLDLAIARYNLDIADTDILRAKAGSATRGVASGLVQGTPGGGVLGLGSGAPGAGAGGTTTGTGGAGTGASGLVQSTTGTGSAISSFDPILTGTLQIEHAKSPLSNTITTGTPSLQQNTGTADFSYFQGFKFGEDLTVGFNNQRATTNSLFTSLIPQVSSSFRATLRQHLLQGFGLLPNTRFIKIANNNRKIGDQAFKLQVITTVSQIQNIYWDLVNAYQNVLVAERSLALANKTLSDNRKQVEIGTLAPIEIVRAESEASTSNQNLIVAQTNLQLQQLLIKNAITRNSRQPQIAAAAVIPTDTMQLNANDDTGANVNLDQMISDAIRERPDVEQNRIDLINREITRKSARNALLPSTDLFAFYGGSGLAGNPTSTTACGSPLAPPPPNCIATNTSYGTALNQTLTNNNPDYGIGMQVNIPLRNRSAQADQVRSELEYRQAELLRLQLENQVGIDVRNAQFAVEQNRARVMAAQAGRDLAQQSLSAEQKKYALGASTNFNVLQAQRDMTQAEVNLVAAMTAYEKSRVELDRVTAKTLARLNISIDDAVNGDVRKTPSVPEVGPAPPATNNQQMNPPAPYQPAPQTSPAPEPAPAPQTPETK
jgi:outer membrane protein